VNFYTGTIDHLVELLQADQFKFIDIQFHECQRDQSLRYKVLHRTPPGGSRNEYSFKSAPFGGPQNRNLGKEGTLSFV
jgi:hypothetical protein